MQTNNSTPETHIQPIHTTLNPHLTSGDKSTAQDHMKKKQSSATKPGVTGKHQAPQQHSGIWEENRKFKGTAQHQELRESNIRETKTTREKNTRQTILKKKHLFTETRYPSSKPHSQHRRRWFSSRGSKRR